MKKCIRYFAYYISSDGEFCNTLFDYSLEDFKRSVNSIVKRGGRIIHKFQVYYDISLDSCITKEIKSATPEKAFNIEKR